MKNYLQETLLSLFEDSESNSTQLHTNQCTIDNFNYNYSEDSTFSVKNRSKNAKSVPAEDYSEQMYLKDIESLVSSLTTLKTGLNKVQQSLDKEDINKLTSSLSESLASILDLYKKEPKYFSEKTNFGKIVHNIESILAKCNTAYDLIKEKISEMLLSTEKALEQLSEKESILTDSNNEYKVVIEKSDKSEIKKLKDAASYTEEYLNQLETIVDDGLLPITIFIKSLCEVFTSNKKISEIINILNSDFSDLSKLTNEKKLEVLRDKLDSLSESHKRIPTGDTTLFLEDLSADDTKNLEELKNALTDILNNLNISSSLSTDAASKLAKKIKKSGEQTLINHIYKKAGINTERTKKHSNNKSEDNSDDFADEQNEEQENSENKDYNAYYNFLKTHSDDLSAWEEYFQYLVENNKSIFSDFTNVNVKVAQLQSFGNGFKNVILVFGTDPAKNSVLRYVLKNEGKLPGLNSYNIYAILKTHTNEAAAREVATTVDDLDEKGLLGTCDLIFNPKFLRVSNTDYKKTKEILEYQNYFKNIAKTKGLRGEHDTDYYLDVLLMLGFHEKFSSLDTNAISKFIDKPEYKNKNFNWFGNLDIDVESDFTRITKQVYKLIEALDLPPIMIDNEEQSNFGGHWNHLTIKVSSDIIAIIMSNPKLAASNTCLWCLYFMKCCSEIFESMLDMPNQNSINKQIINNYKSAFKSIYNMSEGLVDATKVSKWTEADWEANISPELLKSFDSMKVDLNFIIKDDPKNLKSLFENMFKPDNSNRLPKGLPKALNSKTLQNYIDFIVRSANKQ